jgi:hypothetical protein
MVIIKKIGMWGSCGFGYTFIIYNGIPTIVQLGIWKMAILKQLET